MRFRHLHFAVDLRPHLRRKLGIGGGKAARHGGGGWGSAMVDVEEKRAAARREQQQMTEGESVRARVCSDTSTYSRRWQVRHECRHESIYSIRV